MNSAEKKASEPSMDDIISSIRNIISDEPQESIPVLSADGPPANTAVPVDPPVVQLTEKQIAEPVAEVLEPAPTPVVEPAFALSQTQIIEEEPIEPAPAVTPFAETSPFSTDPVLSTPLNSAEIASEIASVPGVMVAGALPPIEAFTPEVPPLAAPLVPELPPIEDALLDSVEPALLFNAEPVLQTPEQDNKSDSLTARIDDLSSTSPASVLDAPGVEEINNLAPAPVNSIEDMIEASSSPGEEESFAQANGVESERILEGMEIETNDLPIAAVLKETDIEETAEAKLEESPLDEASTDNAPVVLDASKVTAEDAVAISAVAAATSEALAGTSAPAEPKEGCNNSLEDSIKAMLKPMIRDWLDDNMPRILEGAIKEEVKDSGSDDKV
ncbi:MAG: DUF2497 domain-containing protein [Hyphomicrobiaceae bacterium]|nr:DUF2497 domain-containing protein [Hyphomicrobiaceae bacterium]